MRKIYLLLLLLFISICSFSQSRNISATTKKIVYSRDGGVCQCCGSSIRLEYDHITPFSCGGASDASNIQLLCMSCNRSKSNSCVCKVHHKTVGTNCCDGKTTKNRHKAPVHGLWSDFPCTFFCFMTHNYCAFLKKTVRQCLR